MLADLDVEAALQADQEVFEVIDPQPATKQGLATEAEKKSDQDLTDAMSAIADEPSANATKSASLASDKPVPALPSQIEPKKDFAQVTNKFEQAFIDEDADDDDSADAKKAPVVQAPTNLATLSGAERSIALMETNVKGAGITLEKVKSSIKELQTLSQTAKGVAKKELTKVIKKKQERVTELEKHLKEGNLLIADKKKSKAQTPKDAAPQASQPAQSLAATTAKVETKLKVYSKSELDAKVAENDKMWEARANKS